MVEEEYYTRKRSKVLDEIEGYKAQIAEIDGQLQFETDPKKHATLRQKRMELESAIEIAQAKFNVIDREREDQIKAERAAAYNEAKKQLADVSTECAQMENRLYMLLAKKLVPDLDDVEKLWLERGSIEAEINLLATASGEELEGVPVTPPTVLGLPMLNNDFRAPNIAKVLVEAIQRHHQIFQAAVKRGRKPQFRLSKELLASVGEFSVDQNGEIFRQSPERQAVDRMKQEAKRNPVLEKDEVN